MTIRFTGDESYPIALDNGWGELAIHRFDLYDDDEWNDFINALNSYRNEYIRQEAKKRGLI